jgi:hypothetical protein
MINTKKALPRRTILRGMGATLALPLLDAMVPALTAVGPPWVGQIEDGVRGAVSYLRPRAGLTTSLENLQALRADVDAVLSGDRDAFRVLVDREGASVVRACHRVLGDLHEAEDAAQEAFLTAYCSLEQLRSSEAFSGWLRRIVRTRCRLLRREHPIAIASLDALDQLEAGAGLNAGQIAGTEAARGCAICWRSGATISRAFSVRSSRSAKTI